MSQKVSDSNSRDLQFRAASDPGSGIGDAEVKFREALIMWLRWNEAYEHATSHLFVAGESSAKLEDFMDSLDQLRREAISLSQALLD
jgi:hypothetical protein